MESKERSGVGGISSGRELAVYQDPLSLSVLTWTGQVYEAFELESPGLDPVVRLGLLAGWDRRAADMIRRLGRSVDGADLWISLLRIGCCPRVVGDTAWKKLSEDSPSGHLLSALLQLLDRHFESDHEATSILERRASDLEVTAQCERLVGPGTTRTCWPVSRSGTVEVEISNGGVPRALVSRAGYRRDR